MDIEKNLNDLKARVIEQTHLRTNSSVLIPQMEIAKCPARIILVLAQ